MNSNIEEKRIWQTPEVIDLEIENTNLKTPDTFEGGGKMPAAS